MLFGKRRKCARSRLRISIANTFAEIVPWSYVASAVRGLRSINGRRAISRVLGDTEVEITADRESDSRFEDNFTHHVKRCRFGEFAAMLEERGETNDFYLVSKNGLLQYPAAAPLLADFHVPEALEESGNAAMDGALWIGPAGTCTPLHHDACNILFTQVLGRKRVYLVPPLYIPRLYNDRTCFSSVDLERLDYARFPLVQSVPVQTVELGPGDALFIPVGWWHQVRSLDVSISLSFTGFRLPRKAHVWPWRKERRHVGYR
jgi:hypothetical protein